MNAAQVQAKSLWNQSSGVAERAFHGRRIVCGVPIVLVTPPVVSRLAVHALPFHDRGTCTQRHSPTLDIEEDNLTLWVTMRASWLSVACTPLAGAVASIAFGECEPLVDGNVIRVLARLRAVASDPKNAGLNKLCW